MDKDLQKAIAILKAGGIVIYPTDTAIGIGCRIDDEKAVERLYQLRKRPVFQPTPVLVDSREMAEKFLITPLPDNVRLLMDSYWPGGLTLVYQCNTNRVLSLVRGGGETLGVRMPDHETTLSLIKGAGVPVLGPSANFHGDPTPYTFAELDRELIKKADFVLQGACKGNSASTVVDCTTEPIRIIRQGAIPLSFKD